MPVTPSPKTDARPSVDAIVIAGGRATRLGGVDKGALLWNGVALRDRVLSALTPAGHLAWVGERWPDAPASTRIRFTLEQPRFGGPAAALQAGLTALPHPLASWLLVVSVDVPRIGSAIPVLLAALSADESDDGVIGVDTDGFRQPLLAIYRTAALAAAVDSHRSGLDGLAFRQLTRGLRLRDVRLPESAALDVDTPADAAYHGIDLPPSTEEPAP